MCTCFSLLLIAATSLFGSTAAAQTPTTESADAASAPCPSNSVVVDGECVESPIVAEPPPGYGPQTPPPVAPQAPATAHAPRPPLPQPVTVQYPAPAAPEDEGPPEHRGFFLRAALGVGYLVATSDPVSVSGVAVNLNIAPGFAIVENLILHGELNASVLPQPTLEGPGGVSISSPDVSFGTVHLGGGLTYFFPINFYISASAGFGVASLTDDASATRASTDPGFSFNSMVGKQFWVSQTITLGASGQFFYQRLPDGPGATFTLLGGGVSFSFTLH